MRFAQLLLSTASICSVLVAGAPTDINGKFKSKQIELIQDSVLTENAQRLCEVTTGLSLIELPVSELQLPPGVVYIIDCANRMQEASSSVRETRLMLATEAPVVSLNVRSTRSILATEALVVLFKRRIILSSKIIDFGLIRIFFLV